jgi:hypothetical protein
VCDKINRKVIYFSLMLFDLLFYIILPHEESVIEIEHKK